MTTDRSRSKLSAKGPCATYRYELVNADSQFALADATLHLPTATITELGGREQHERAVVVSEAGELELNSYLIAATTRRIQLNWDDREVSVGWAKLVQIQLLRSGARFEAGVDLSW